MNNSPTCERALDLIAFVYSEASDTETRDFELHVKECAACRQELASFGIVRESITAWRDEALSGFLPTPLANSARAARKKSAVAALRQFFDLSPLWLKGATAFAVAAFFIFAALAINRTERGSAGSVADKYTQQDVDRIVKEAVANHESSKQADPPPVEKPISVERPRKPKRAPGRPDFAKSRQPLTRAEREQLAADLRLLSSEDEVGLNLLGDRINQ